MATNLGALPLDSGDRTAASHKDWLDDLITQFNALNGQVTALETDATLHGHWPFLEGYGTAVRDVSVEGNHGTITAGSGAWSNDSPFRASYLFNGSKVNCGHDASLDLLGAWTVTAWIKPSSYGGDGHGCILSKEDDSGVRDALSVDQTKQTLRFQKHFATTDGSWRTVDGAIRLNQWQFVAITYDHSDAGNDPVIYVNGISYAVTEETAPVGAPSTFADSDLLIGDSGAGGNGFAGNISDVRCYNMVLNLSEIQKLYLAGPSESPTLQALTVLGQSVLASILGSAGAALVIQPGAGQALQLKDAGGAERFSVSSTGGVTMPASVVV